MKQVQTNDCGRLKVIFHVSKEAELKITTTVTLTNPGKERFRSPTTPLLR